MNKISTSVFLKNAHRGQQRSHSGIFALALAGIHLQEDGRSF